MKNIKKTILETIILFNGDGEPVIKSNQPLDDSMVRLIVSIVHPFCLFPGSRARVEAGVSVKITALMIDEMLDSYSVGFTSSTHITTTRELTVSNV